MDDCRLCCPLSLTLDSQLDELYDEIEGFNDKNVSIRPNSYNFLRHLAFSPSGHQILTVNDFQDVSIHSLEGDYSSMHYYQAGNGAQLPSLSLSRTSSFHLPEAFSDIVWHPDVTSSRVAASVRDQPIHLYSSTGHVLQSYTSLDMEDIEHHQSLLFHPCGHLLYAGSEKKINIFNVEQGGKPIQSVSTVNTKMQDYGIVFGQKGLIACLAHRPDPTCASSTYAAGCFDGSVGIYDDSISESAMNITGLKYAVNCVRWSRCGNYLFVSGMYLHPTYIYRSLYVLHMKVSIYIIACYLLFGLYNYMCIGRKHNSIDCYDVRSRLSVVGKLPRTHSSMQRCTFDLDPWTRLLTTGDEKHQLLTYDTLTYSLVHNMQCKEMVNSVSYHPYASVLAIGMGSRHFIDAYSSSDSDSDRGDADTPKKDVERAGYSGISLLSLPSQRLAYPAEEKEPEQAVDSSAETNNDMMME